MINLEAVIADDEEQLRIHLKSKLSDLWPELAICGEARNGLEALEMIESCRPAIAFLDIKMPGLSGIEVAQKIRAECRVVFITAFDQYAIEAFESEAVDYILKPVTDQRLKKNNPPLEEANIRDSQSCPRSLGCHGAVVIDPEGKTIHWVFKMD